jgi:hypothetical protein
MVSRARRRWLVVGVYVGLAALMWGFWSGEHWQRTFGDMLVATIFVNYFLLGGWTNTGLVRAFLDRRFRRGKIGSPASDPDLLSDEREVNQRDHAHFHSYQAITMAFFLIFLVSGWTKGANRPLEWIPVSSESLLNDFFIAAAVIGLTLPQAILLWTEPDMEPAGEIGKEETE